MANRFIRAVDALAGRGAGYRRSVGGNSRGGIRNPLTGAGGPADKAAHGYFYPTIFNNRQQLDTIYVESWAAAKFIDIIVDDMFIRWRKFEADDEAAVERMEDAERRHDVRGRLSRAMKMGRLYGTGLLVMVTREAPLEGPMVEDRIREGDLVSLLPVDRYDVEVETCDTDLLSSTFGEPLLYRIQPQVSGAGPAPTFVHASRVLRFDGIRPLALRGWQANYEQDWGVSELVPVLTSIMQDVSLASGITHLAQEASMLVVKLKDYQEAITGAGLGPDAMSAEEIGEAINLHKSIWRTIFTDKDADVSRVNLRALGQVLLGDLGGLPEDRDPVPFGTLTALARVLVLPSLGCRHREIGDRAPILGAPDVGVLAEIPDQSHLVDAAGHAVSFLSPGFPPAGMAC